MIHPIRILRTWRSRLRLLDRMEIGARDRVLEVGSGQNPSPRADVLCDRFLVDDTERNAQAVRIDRPFVAGDIYRLPFRDRAFDYVICSHVLEHLERPEDAVAELTRVAPRGYIETPSRVNEKVLSYPFHRWMVTEEDGVLRFREKERAVWDEEVNAWFRELGSRFPPLYDFFFANLHELGNVVSVVWEEKVEVAVDRLDGPRDRTGFVAAGESEERTRRRELDEIRKAFAGRDGSGGWKRSAESLLTRLLRRRSTPRIDLDASLACPVCRGDLRPGEEDLVCRECGRDYPVLELFGRRIPFLVPEEA